VVEIAINLLKKLVFSLAPPLFRKLMSKPPLSDKIKKKPNFRAK
jgi:hypothetical protein